LNPIGSYKVSFTSFSCVCNGIELDSWGRHAGEHISTPDFTCKERETETCHDKRRNASSVGKVRGKQADYGKTTSVQYENARPFLYLGPSSAPS